MEVSRGYLTATFEVQGLLACNSTPSLYLRNTKRHGYSFYLFLQVMNYTIGTALATPSWTDIAEDGPFLLS